MKDKNIKSSHVRETLKFAFSLSMLKHCIYSYAYAIHEHVAWRKYMQCGENIRVHPTASIRFPKNVYLGENSHINMNCCIWPGEHSKIILGDNLLMGPGVSIQAANHGLSRDSVMNTQPETEKDIVVGNDCWIGSNATILAGVHIADGCVVAAGAVVTKSITEPYSVVGGIPAKVISVRKSMPSPQMPEEKNND